MRRLPTIYPVHQPTRQEGVGIKGDKATIFIIDDPWPRGSGGSDGSGDSKKRMLDWYKQHLATRKKEER